MKIVYIGRTQGRGKSLVHKYLDCENDETIVFKRKISSHKIGMIIDCRKTETGVRGPYTITGIHQNNDDIRKWLNRDKAVYDESMTLSYLDKKLPDIHNDTVQVICKSYKELLYAQRIAFINRLIIDITK